MVGGMYVVDSTYMVDAESHDPENWKVANDMNGFITMR